jgi:hypothetical protein
MWTARALAASLLTALVIAPVTPAEAADGAAPDLPVRLTWKAPPECPTASAVLADARTLVVHRDALAAVGPIAVDAVVARVAASRWTLTLAVGNAQQRLEAPSCADLARAGALFVALLIDPERRPSTANPGSGVAGAPPPGPPAPPRASPPASKRNASAAGAYMPADFNPRRGARGVSLLAGAGIMVDVGTLPRAGVLGVLSGGIRVGRLDLMLEAATGAPQDTNVGGSAGARLMAASATFKPCYAAVLTGHVRFEPCLPIEVGWMHGEGIGIARSRSADSVWWSFGGALALGLTLGDRFEVRVDVVALVPIVRPNFELTGVGTVFEPGIAIRAGTAVVVRF